MLMVKVTGIQGAKVQITDGTNTMVVSKKQLDEKIADGSVQIANLKVKCVEKIRDKNNNIVNYRIADNNGAEIIVDAKQLKEKIKTYQVECLNLTLTSDNRLVDKDGVEAAKVTGGKQETPQPSRTTNANIPQKVEQHKETTPKMVTPTKLQEQTQNLVIECGKGIGENTYIVLSDEGDTSNKHEYSYYKCINSDATRIKITSDSAHKIDSLELKIRKNKNHLINIDEMIFNSHISAKNNAIIDKIIAKNSLTFKYETNIKISGITANKIYIIDESKGKIGSINGNVEINCKELYIKYGLEIEDGTLVTMNAYSEIKIKDNYASEEGELRNHISKLIDEGKLKINVKYNSPAFHYLLNNNIPFELIDKENNDKMKQMNRSKQKEQILGISNLEIKYNESSRVYENRQEQTKMVNIENLGLNLDIPDIVVSTYGLRLGSKEDEMSIGKYNIVDTIIKATVPNIDPFTTPFIQLVNDINYKHEIVFTEYLDCIRVSILAIEYVGCTSTDYYIIMTNGRKLVHMTMLDNVTINKRNIDTETILDAYKIFDHIKGVSENGIIKQSLTTKTIDEQLNRQIVRYLYNLKDIDGVYFKCINTFIAKLSDDKYFLIKYINTKSRREATLLNKPKYSYEAVGFNYKECNDIQKEFDSIKSRINNAYASSVANYIKNNVIGKNKASTEQENGRLRAQKKSEIWAFAKYYKTHIKSSKNLTEFLSTLDSTDLENLFAMKIFNETDEKEFNKVKTHSILSVETSSFGLEWYSCSTQSKCIGDLMHSADSKIKVVDYISGEESYYMCMFSSYYMFDILHTLATGSIGIDPSKVYADINSNYTRAWEKTKELLYIDDSIVKYDKTLNTRCAILERSANWYIHGAGRSLTGTLEIVIDPKTGLYYLLNDFTHHNRKIRHDLCTKVIIRIADTKAAMLLIKQLQAENGSRKIHALIEDLCRISRAYHEVLFGLQNRNVSDIEEYISKLDAQTYNFYRPYISYNDGDPELEDTDMQIELDDIEEIDTDFYFKLDEEDDIEDDEIEDDVEEDEDDDDFDESEFEFEINI